MRQWHALREAGRTGGVEDHGDFFRRHVDRVEGPGIEQAVELLDGDGRHQRADQRRALGIGDRQLDDRVLHDVRYGLARQLVVDADRDEAGRHGGHVEHEIVGAVGRDDRDRLAALQAALQEAAGQRRDARPRLAVAQAELLVALRRDLDDEGPVGWRLRVENGGEVLEAHGSLIAQRVRTCK
jgi:hypothetical protein